MRIDIIIPTCKKKEDIQKLINDIEYNTPENHRLICTCQPLSASKNRNYGLSYVNSELFIMCDDDITGFYLGWLTNLIYPMQKDKNIIMCSARLLFPNREWNNNMGMYKTKESYTKLTSAFNENGIEYKRITTACLSLRKNNIRFDENFKGSGYEDTDYSNQLSEEFNGMDFIVNNQCELIHENKKQGQGNQNIWQENHDYYSEKYPWDTVCNNQKFWGSK